MTPISKLLNYCFALVSNARGSIAKGAWPGSVDRPRRGQGLGGIYPRVIRKCIPEQLAAEKMMKCDLAIGWGMKIGNITIMQARDCRSVLCGAPSCIEIWIREVVRGAVLDFLDRLATPQDANGPNAQSRAHSCTRVSSRRLPTS